MHCLVTEMLPLAFLLGDKRKSFKRLISSTFGFEVELIDILIYWMQFCIIKIKGIIILEFNTNFLNFSQENLPKEEEANPRF